MSGSARRGGGRQSPLTMVFIARLIKKAIAWPRLSPDQGRVLSLGWMRLDMLSYVAKVLQLLGALAPVAPRCGAPNFCDFLKPEPIFQDFFLFSNVFSSFEGILHGFFFISGSGWAGGVVAQGAAMSLGCMLPNVG